VHGVHDAATEAFRLSLHSRVAIRRVHLGHPVIAHGGRVSRPAHVGVAPECHQAPLTRMPDEEIIYRFQLSRVLPAGTDTASMIALNRTLYERARDIGGYRMTSSAVAMSQDDWKRHYGPAWQTVQAAKTKFDPKNVLTPGHGMFPG
jgi:Cytokinin dehydrogenase 1, FAD and cytokinin binding.